MKDHTESKSLFDLYRQFDLSLDWVRPANGFTILNLKDAHFDLPYRSASFRPDYFSFLFVKDGVGQYTIDEHSFHIESHSVYFTNPSNYRTFGWDRIEQVYLITFSEIPTFESCFYK